MSEFPGANDLWGANDPYEGSSGPWDEGQDPWAEGGDVWVGEDQDQDVNWDRGRGDLRWEFPGYLDYCLDPFKFTYIVGIVLQLIFIPLYALIYCIFFSESKAVTKMHMFVFYINSSFWGWAFYIFLYEVACGGFKGTDVFITALALLGLFGLCSCIEMCCSREGGYFRHQKTMNECIQSAGKRLVEMAHLLEVSLTFSHLLLFSTTFTASFGDHNLMSGANDIVAVRDRATGDLKATPFSVQFGKKDVWLPRAGHNVNIAVNGWDTGLEMNLDKNGRGYFRVGDTGMRGTQYRFWSALFSTADPSSETKTTSATPAQLDLLALKPGRNNITFKVITGGSIHTINNSIYLFDDTQRIVVSDIDGTITKSDVRGFVFPALGVSHWKHSGLVSLYVALAGSGYQLLYLSARPVGLSSSTRSYLTSLQEEGERMPHGPIFLHVGSVLEVIGEHVFRGRPEISKIAKLSHVLNVFPTNPFYSAYGNKATDVLTYTALNINPDNIYEIDEQSEITSEGTGLTTNLTQHISNIDKLYPRN